MVTEKIISLINNPQEITNADVSKLDSLLIKHPYFSSAQLLLTKGLLNTDSIRYNRQLKKAAAYSLDRQKLFSLITLNNITKVEAIIRPSKLKAIQKGLKNVDIPCITVIPVSGTGLQKSYTKMYRGTEQSLALQNRTMIICVISDENLEKCVDTILEFGSDGQVGDGKIFIYDVQDAIRLSTKVRGDQAIV